MIKVFREMFREDEKYLYNISISWNYDKGFHEIDRWQIGLHDFSETESNGSMVVFSYMVVW